MKLFQIEEPDGSPIDPDAPGVAIGIDLGGAEANVAVAVGGNAAVLRDREGFERDLPVPLPGASLEEWRVLFEGAKLRAERALAQPVTHAVVALASAPPPALAARLMAASEAAGLTLLQIVARAAIGPAEDQAEEQPVDRGEAPALAAAILAEDLVPRPAAD